MENRMISCSENLSEWARENGIQDDPKRISKIHDEAWRRWGHEMSRIRIGKILVLTLKMIK